MKDLPLGAIEAISKYDGYEFKAGDKEDNVNLGDSHSSKENELTTELNFVLTGDSFCLISYTKGGFVARDFVDFVQYKNHTHICRYWPRDAIKDTFALHSSLQDGRYLP